MKTKMHQFAQGATQTGIIMSSWLVAGRALADCTDTGVTSGDPQVAAQCAQGSKAPSTLFGNGGIFQRISNILIFIVGAVAVIMLIIGGLRYVLSSGNSSAVEGAKNTILYAIIGIIVAILAYAIVNFVLTGILSQPSSSFLPLLRPLV